jgi:hypothetical protein
VVTSAEPCTNDDLPAALVPQIELADRWDRCVHELSPWLRRQPSGHAREAYLDLMVGLATGADAMRALVAGDAPVCVQHLESAVRHLRRVCPADLVTPERA